MKLIESTDTLRCSQPFQNADFTIGDPILIMEYLRKHAYSNPKRSICQEIMSNARDAHREVGTPDKPIEVRLPTRLNPIWACKDHGPGISPDRMENVFIKFGNSTKRSDNSQTGGFGVGAKLPWSYTDTFLINTVCNIDGTCMKYSYAAVIGDNRVPKLIQLSDPVPTDETPGTTISFTVEAKDFSDFTTYSYEVSQYWNPRPNIINGDNNHWKDIEYKFKESNWGIVKHRNYGDPNYVLIDGIPYVLNINNLGSVVKEDEKEVLRNLSSNFYFNVGELTVSLNREGLFYDDRTIKAIIIRFREMIKWITKHFENLIASSNTLWDAALALKEATSFFSSCQSIFKSTNWRGIVVPTCGVRGTNNCKIIHYERDGFRIRRRTKDNSFEFTKSSKLVLEDTKSKIEHQFSLDGTLKHVYVIKYIVNTIESAKSKVAWDQWVTANNIMNLEPIKIETLPVAPRKSRISVSDGSHGPNIRIKTYVWKNGCWKDAEIDSKTIRNGVGIYVPCYRRHSMKDNSCEHEMDDGVIGSIVGTLNDPKLIVYGIQKDLLPNLGKNWVCLYDYFKTVLIQTAADYKVSIGNVIDYISVFFNDRIDKDRGFGKALLENAAKLPKELANFCKVSEGLQVIKDLPKFPLQCRYCTQDTMRNLNLQSLAPDYAFILKAIENIKKENPLYDDLSLDWDRAYEHLDHLFMYFYSVKAKQDQENAMMLVQATAA